MIVVDVNVIAYLMITGDKTGLTRRLFRQEPNWRLPPLWRHEFLNVLATYVRHSGATVEDARKIWQQSLHLFSRQESNVDLLEALRLACRHKVSAYDAQYILLAIELGVPCVTEDQQLLTAFPTIAQPIQTLLAG
jgi:predicted nucleic acid-binding protein